SFFRHWSLVIRPSRSGPLHGTLGTDSHAALVFAVHEAAVGAAAAADPPAEAVARTPLAFRRGPRSGTPARAGRARPRRPDHTQPRWPRRRLRAAARRRPGGPAVSLHGRLASDRQAGLPWPPRVAHARLLQRRSRGERPARLPPGGRDLAEQPLSAHHL